MEERIERLRQEMREIRERYLRLKAQYPDMDDYERLIAWGKDHLSPENVKELDQLFMLALESGYEEAYEMLQAVRKEARCI